MKKLLAKVLRSAAVPLLAFVGIIGMSIYNHSREGKLPPSEDLGAWLGLIFALIILLGPLLYIHGMGIKIKNPRPVFVEPPLWVVTLGLVASWVLLVMMIFMVIIIVALVDLAISGTGTPEEAAQPSFIGNFLMGLGILLFTFGPSVIYVICIKLRYKKIIEYNTPEWKKYYERKKKQSK